MTSTTPSRLERAHAWIDEAYGRLALVDPEFRIRDSQKQLSKAVSHSFIDGTPLAAEAPTGTGKTLAYLLGALAAGATSSATMKEPVVVSTATKALQQQLFSKDLPLLARANLIDLDDVSIAKGKGNYLCLKQAEETAMLLERGMTDPELFVDEATEQLDADQVGAMVQSFSDSYWDGDFDNYEGARPKNVRTIAVSSDTCTRKKCAHYNECAYFKARTKMSFSKIVVVNHDLLLLDLWLSSEDIEPTLPVANYLIVFDEAHHLPEKAIKVGSTEAQLTVLQRQLPKLGGVQKLLKSNAILRSMAGTKGIKDTDFDRISLGNALRELVDMLAMVEVDPDSCQKLFARGVLPTPLVDAIKRVEGPLSDMMEKLSKLTEILRESNGTLGPDALEKANELLRRSLDVKVPGEAAMKAFIALLGAKRSAKWLFRKDGATALHTAPLEASDVLGPLLWENERAIASVMVSATLRDLGGYSRFASRVGLPKTTRYETLPYTFPYEKSTLMVAAMAATPKMAERRQFLSELTIKLPKAINAKEATLVLFPSWAMLREFGPKLKDRFGHRNVRVQGEDGRSIKMLVREHCEAIDRGEGSILLGVQTLAEGLDLPGAYCSHVIIISLPFAVPTDPVEQELSAILGNKYFSERSLPDAMTRLTQMVGRLLRRESDIGRVTVFDRRLASTSYGRQMLSSLPPFKKVIEPLAS